ncbi:MAG: hypothetical protein Q7S58_09865 [Candidatus Binatus sp.]|uniref:hypothetical protein n=1 Tax=Candidatus Binatus sp. TaxID=2811406 RepID=UPI00271BA4FB|nr:hypothetical protein [Candidatus Binatus sp.]MDO8432702.1 hypothetical protein [Candidatus Binatus sp.]
MDGLLVTDSVMPSQFNQRRTTRSGEERLLFAVLKDAITDFLGDQPQASKEAARWLRHRGCRHPFTFENICDVFGIDSGWFRQGLLRQRALLDQERSMLAAAAASIEPAEYLQMKEVSAGPIDAQF